MVLAVPVAIGSIIAVLMRAMRRRQDRLTIKTSE